MAKEIVPRIFCKQFELKDEVMPTTEIESKTFEIFGTRLGEYPKNSVIKSSKGIVIIDDGTLLGTHW